MLSLAGGGGGLKQSLPLDLPLELPLELPLVRDQAPKDVKDTHTTPAQSQPPAPRRPQDAQVPLRDSNKAHPSICWATPNDGGMAMEAPVQRREIGDEVVGIGQGKGEEMGQQTGPVVPPDNRQTVYIGGANDLV